MICSHGFNGSSKCPDCRRERRQKRKWGGYKKGTQCEICKTTEGPFRVDHDHNCCGDRRNTSVAPPCGGKCTRGTLCVNCNIMLGHAHDDVEVLRKAIEYLKKWSKL